MPAMIGGAHIIRDPVFINVYWHSGWDAATLSAIRSPMCSMANIDAFTRNLVAGSYFDKLSQYGVSGQSARFGGSVQVGTTPPPALTRAAITTFAGTLFSAPPPGLPAGAGADRTVFNIFLPLSTTLVGEATPPRGYHFMLVGQAAITVTISSIISSTAPVLSPIGILTRTPGLGLLQGLTGTLTHEMAEAATDPDGNTGWRDRTIEDGEVADIISGARSVFLAGNTADYWSNEDGGNVPGHGDLTPPDIASVRRTSPTPGLHIEIRGSGFGDAPPDIAIPGFGLTEFLILRDDTASVSAGHPASPVVAPATSPAKLNFITWRDDLIVIDGCDDDRVESHDELGIQVFGRRNGQPSVEFKRAAAFPVAILPERVDPTVYAGEFLLTIRGQVIDQFGDPFKTRPGKKVKFSSAYGTDTTSVFAHANAHTDIYGWFENTIDLSRSGRLLLTFSLVQDSVTTLTAQRELRVIPQILGLSPDHCALDRAPDDRRVITIAGVGLKDVSAVDFGGRHADILNWDSGGTWLTASAPPNGGLGGNEIGWVKVVARVNTDDPSAPAIESPVGPLTLFAYYEPRVPVMRPALPGFECNPAALIADLWEENGAPMRGDALAEIVRFRTDRGSFSATDPAQREFTPGGLRGNQVLAFLYESDSGSNVYLPSVGLDAADELVRSERQVVFSDVLCHLQGRMGSLKKRVSIGNIRQLLKRWVVPPIPKDRFADLARPLRAEIEMVSARRAKANSKASTHEMQVRVVDAHGKPVAGLPVAFLSSSGMLTRKLPTLTNKQGLVKSGFRLSGVNHATIHAIVDEHPRILTIEVKAAKKQTVRRRPKK